MSSLSLLAYCRRCLRLVFGASSSKSSSFASHCRRCFVGVGSGVPSCGCVRYLLRLVVGLLSAAASPQSKLTHPFVPKCKKVIGTNRELFEIVLALFFLQHVSGLSNQCKFALANGLAGRFILRY